MSKYIEDEYMPDAVRSAYQVVNLWEENQELLRLVKRGKEFERKYNELLNESVKRGQVDCANWMRFLLSDRVKLLPAESADQP